MRSLKVNQNWKQVKYGSNHGRQDGTSVLPNKPLKVTKNPLQKLRGNLTTFRKSQDRDTFIQRTETRRVNHEKHYRTKHSNKNNNLDSDFEETNVEKFKTDEEWQPEDDWLIENLIAPAKPSQHTAKKKDALTTTHRRWLDAM